MHVDGPGVTQEEEKQWYLRKDGWQQPKVARNLTRGNQGWKRAGKYPMNHAMGSRLTEKTIPWSRGVYEAEKGRHTSDLTTYRWDQPDGKEGGDRKAWG